jgi:dienelactone hydrolase
MNPMRAIAMALLLCATGYSQVVTKEIVYRDDSTTYRGFLATSRGFKGMRPAVLVVHEWWGLNDFVKQKAKELADAGYVAFAPDMYGEGRVTTDPKMAGTMAGQVRGTPRMRQRVLLGLATLLKQADADSQHVAAMGFCFGGTAVLELAYSGADVKGVITFHGGLMSLKPEERKAIKAKFLVLHGADDPFAPPDTVRQFQQSLRDAGVDWQMIYFGNSVHGFTNPANGSDNSKGLAYNPASARRAWQYSQEFLREVFASGTR